MIIDTSALLAILFDEPERSAFTRSIAEAGRCLLSVGTYLEAAIVVEARLGPRGSQELEFLLERAGIEFVPMDTDQVAMALHGWRLYGKGRRPAGLNYGDCFAYGLAKLRDEVLLFKGHDFSQTDIAPAR